MLFLLQKKSNEGQNSRKPMSNKVGLEKICQEMSKKGFSKRVFDDVRYHFNFRLEEYSRRNQKPIVEIDRRNYAEKETRKYVKQRYSLDLP